MLLLFIILFYLLFRLFRFFSFKVCIPEAGTEINIWRRQEMGFRPVMHRTLAPWKSVSLQEDVLTLEASRKYRETYCVPWSGEDSWERQLCPYLCCSPRRLKHSLLIKQCNHNHITIFLFIKWGRFFFLQPKIYKKKRNIPIFHTLQCWRGASHFQTTHELCKPLCNCFGCKCIK